MEQITNIVEDIGNFFMVPFSLIIICRTESCRRRRRRSAGTGQNHHGRFGSSPRSITTRRREEQAGRFQSFGLQRRPAAAGLDPSSSGSVRSATEYSDFSGRFWSQLLLWDICRPPPNFPSHCCSRTKRQIFCCGGRGASSASRRTAGVTLR